MTDALSRSFAPIATEHVTTLVLGTMPGQQSLAAKQYYAHPQNAFWPIIEALASNQAPDRQRAMALSYAERCACLNSLGIAVWDVLAECRRPGSLDSRIERPSEVPNPLDSWVAQQASLTTIALNGQTAAKLLKRHFSQADFYGNCRLLTLPSTSPAHASLTLEQKHSLWKNALNELPASHRV